MCVFCKEDNIRPLLMMESDLSYAICSKNPITQLGHFLVIPKSHAEDVLSLSAAEQLDLFALYVAVLEKVKSSIKPEGINCLINEGKVAGQTVPHLHIHIICRMENDGINNFRKDNGPKEIITEDDIHHFQNLFT